MPHQSSKNIENIDISSFKHKIPIQIRYADIDMQGHVNNATLLTYIEQGRVAYFNLLFPDNDFQKNGLIIARTEIDYLAPVFLHEEIFCCTKVSSFRNKSFIFENILISVHQDIKCYAKSIMVCFDYIKNSTILVPHEWKNKIEKFEGILNQNNKK